MKITVLEACNILQTDLLNENSILSDFILENYGDNRYLVTYDDTAYLEYSKIRLYDEWSQDKITIIKRKNKETIGQEELAIYHSSPVNNAKGSYNFYLNYKNTEIIYHGIDVSSTKEKVFITKTHFIGNKDEIKEKYITEFKVQDKESAKYAKVGIRSLIHHLEKNKVKVLSKKRKIEC